MHNPLFSDSTIRGVNLVDNSRLPTVQVGKTVTPSTPFIWYREQHIMCPIEMVLRLPPESLLRLVPALPDHPGECYVIVQRHVLSDAPLYLCNHSVGYRWAHPGGQPLVIPPRYNHTFVFEGIAAGVPPGEVRGMWFGQPTRGGAHIHDMAYSPPGTFRFAVDTTQRVNQFLATMECRETGGRYTALFVIVTDVGKDADTHVMETIEDIVHQLTA